MAYRYQPQFLTVDPFRVAQLRRLLVQRDEREALAARRNLQEREDRAAAMYPERPLPDPDEPPQTGLFLVPPPQQNHSQPS